MKTMIELADAVEIDGLEYTILDGVSLDSVADIEDAPGGFIQDWFEAWERLVRIQMALEEVTEEAE